MTKKSLYQNFATPYGKRMGGKARVNDTRAVINTGTAIVTGIGAGVSAFTGDPIGAGLLGTVAATSAILAGVQLSDAQKQIAKGHAVEGISARAKGGSAALGMAGLSPDKMAGFAHAQHEFVSKQGHSGTPPTNENSSVAEDTFTRHRHDARSSKPITETVRKRGRKQD